MALTDSCISCAFNRATLSVQTHASNAEQHMAAGNQIGAKIEFRMAQQAKKDCADLAGSMHGGNKTCTCC